MIVEQGRCSPLDCNTGSGFINCGEGGEGDACTIGSCSPTVQIPANVPIKQLLKGSVASPWVRLKFFGIDGLEVTEITTGNISQPGTGGCHAAVKSFQYGWGAINSGNKCKITIMDEEGGSFTSWFRRLNKNPINASLNNAFGTYKMQVTFGWLLNGIDGECPAVVQEGASGGCLTTPADFPGYYSSNPNQLVCSPPLWFLPDQLTMSSSNGKFVYELEGVDLIYRASEQPVSWVFGQDGTGDNGGTFFKVYLKEAIEALAARCTPPFRVEFKQLNETSGVVEDLKFYVPPSVGNIPHARIIDTNPYVIVSDVQNVEPTELESLGPLGIWRCDAMNPLAAIQQWLTEAKAKSEFLPHGKGLTMNYDSTYEDPCLEIDNCDSDIVVRGRLIIWADSFPNCVAQNFDYESRLKAAYIVNGGNCSPVYGFTPNIRYNFQTALRAGGLIGPNSGEIMPAARNVANAACQAPGTGARNQGTVPTNALDRGGNQALENVEALAAHRRANAMHYSIETELRVQGDPSDWLCSPVYGYGRTIAIVYINPFYLTDNNSADCMDWEWKTLTTTACNEVLTNKGWFIKGVDHQIKEGSYITTYKIILFTPRAETGGENNMNQPEHLDGEALCLGLDASRISGTSLLCDQATWTCDDKIVMGAASGDITAGTNTFCELTCRGDLGVA